MKRHAAKVLLAVLGMIIAYYLFVVIKGYVQTPELVAVRWQQSERPLALDEFSEEYLHILLAVEDPNFFSHNGIDLRTPGAGLTTVTQALAKDLYFEQFRPGLAKIEQLRLFINTVYYGNHRGAAVNGFTAAARIYFDKAFAELSREEYLALVAMIIAPNDFNVAAHREKNAQRVQRIERLLRGECKPDGLRDVYYENCN